MPGSTHLVLPALMGAVVSAASLAQGPVATVVVGAGTAGGRLVAQGQVVAVRQARLSAQAPGRITEVLVRSGEQVRRGQVLLRIDSPAAQAAAEADGAQAGAAAAQLDSAQADFQRARRLHDKGYLSDAAFERAQAQLKAVQAQSAAALARAKASREAAGWAQLRAPYDGRLTAVYVAAGDLASPGQPLISLYEPGPMRVLADVPERSADSLAPGQPVQITYGGGCGAAPRELKTWVAVPAIDPRSRSVEIRIEVGDPGNCLPGTLARVSLPLRDSRATFIVPATAVVRRGELDAVYVIGSGERGTLRQVRLGEPRDDGIEILAGLEPGERVVRDAARYRAAPAGGAAP